MKVMQLTVGVVGTNCYIVYDEATRGHGPRRPPEVPFLRSRGGNAQGEAFSCHARAFCLAVHDVLEATGRAVRLPEADTWLLSRDNMGGSLARAQLMCRIRRIFWPGRARPSPSAA